MNSEENKENEKQEPLVITSEPAKTESQNTPPVKTEEEAKREEVGKKWFQKDSIEEGQQMGTKQLELPGENIEIKAAKFDKSDIKWYVMIGVFVILMLIPPITWVLFPDVTSAPEIRIQVTVTLSCNGIDTYENSFVNKTFESVYVDGAVTNTKLYYRMVKKQTIPDDQEVNFNTENIPEIMNFKAATNPNLVIEEPSSTQFNVTIDWKKDSFLDVPELQNHNSVAQVQINNYQKLKMVCSTERKEEKIEIPREY